MRNKNEECGGLSCSGILFIGIVSACLGIPNMAFNIKREQCRIAENVVDEFRVGETLNDPSYINGIRALAMRAFPRSSLDVSNIPTNQIALSEGCQRINHIDIRLGNLSGDLFSEDIFSINR